MALKRLPNDVQSLLCASARVNSYKRAIEELIYNSLDAKSTSVAIRVHIQENTIQVIDNGTGITKHDFDVIGQRHMTSKITDVATLKAAPKNYGFRGEFLANIITVSKMVKITSRHNSAEDTWAKTFVNGKESKFTHVATRPTKGTTVDIKGFLYNLNIQKRGIDPMHELQNIKSFLEQLSLVQSHISLSLRDDSKNEIVFKIHKKRDIYQTFLTLFDIDKLDVLELQVEKDEYKVKGYIGKVEKNLDLHWIYLNGKYIHTCSKLHKVLNDYFKKSLHIKDQKTLKSKKQNNDELRLFNQNIPFHFIFISCPYIDYDISYTPKQSVIEFKKWDQINKLLEKLVKFYVGDVNFKEIKKVENKLTNKKQINNKLNQDTRDEVKKIMNKILGNNSKKLGISQLQNGIKGKMVKRKVKKKTNPKLIMPKLYLQNDNKFNNDNRAPTESKVGLISENNIEEHIVQKTIDDLDKREDHKARVSSCKPRNNKKQKGPVKCQNKDIVKHKQKRELKINNLSPAKKKNKTTTKQRHNTLNKHKKVKVNDNEFKYSTDSVCKRSKIIAQKAEDFLESHTNERNINIIHQLKNAIGKRQKNIINAQKNKNTFKDILPRPLKPNKSIIEKYIMNKLKAKSYKTTYDLVHTILNSQNVLNIAQNNSSAELYKKFHRPNDILRSITYAPKQYPGTNNFICNEYSVNDTRKEKSQHTIDISAGYKTYLFEENLSIYEQNKNISNSVTNFSERFKCINNEENIYSTNQNIYCTQNETSCHPLSGPLSILTFDSHQYHQNEVLITNDIKKCYAINKKQNIRFITKEFRENFITSNDFKNRFKKQTKITNIRMTQTIDESSYTIECSKSNGNMYNTAQTVNYEPIKLINELDAVFGNTYSIHQSNTSFNQSITTENQVKRGQNAQSNKQFETYSIHESHSEVNEDNTKSNDEFDRNSRNFNIVFVSKSQRAETDSSLNNNMILEPINVCETVFYEIGSDEKEFAVSFNENNRLNDSLYDNFRFINPSVNQHVETRSQGNDNVATENVSHHFNCTVKPKQNCNDDNYQDLMVMEYNQNKITNNIYKRTGDFPGLGPENNINAKIIDCNFEINFNLKNRPRFVPKGMSQIFENCNTKTVCDYNMDKDYFEDSIYNNFANDVQVNSEIYIPVIQNVEDLTTKDIHKFQNKVKKDNASLVFDETSLKEAKILGQVDCKFIVTIMKKRCGLSKEAFEYLILFDQHAVHERIRLETNLADYLKDEIWTSVAVDNFILKMSKDEILYLHNYKDKFAQLGLQWTILSENEVTVHSIPEAILGKNPREVEKAIEAVRNLIVEEINVIKSQKGCVSLYPKSIMDLVFSESCRYAIKFGDPLYKSDCVELLSSLSNCKTPFQCAHGRPVMAVIMDIIPERREYKINVESLRRFRQRNKRNV